MGGRGKLIYRVSSRTPRTVTQRNPISKIQRGKGGEKAEAGGQPGLHSEIRSQREREKQNIRLKNKIEGLGRGLRG